MPIACFHRGHLHREGVQRARGQALVCAFPATRLDLESDLKVVAEVGRSDEVVAAAWTHRPDVTLLDVEMPGLEGSPPRLRTTTACRPSGYSS